MAETTREVCRLCHNSGLVVLMRWEGTSEQPIQKLHAEICTCVAGQAYAAAIEEGIRDVEAGRVTPWEQVKHDLGLDALAQKGD